MTNIVDGVLATGGVVARTAASSIGGAGGVGAMHGASQVYHGIVEAGVQGGKAPLLESGGALVNDASTASSVSKSVTGNMIGERAEQSAIDALTHGQHPIEALANLEEFNSSQATKENEEDQDTKELLSDVDVFRDVQEEPEYQQILGQKLVQAQKDGKGATVEQLQKEALSAYLQVINDKIVPEAIEQAEHQEKSSLTDAERRSLIQQIQHAYRKNSVDTIRATKYVGDLVKAKIKEKNIREDAQATDEQKSDAAMHVRKLQVKFDDQVALLEARLGQNHALIAALKELQNNLAFILLLQSEVKKLKLVDVLKFLLLLILTTTSGMNTAVDTYVNQETAGKPGHVKPRR